MRVRARARACASAYAYACACVSACACVCVCVRVCAGARVRACVPVACKRPRVPVRVHVCARVCELHSHEQEINRTL